MEIESKEDLKNNLSLYLKLKDEENQLKDKISKLKSKSDDIHDSILNYMNEKEILDKELIFDKRKIKCTQSKISESITKKLILDRLMNYFEDESKANEITNYIYNNRKSTNKILLKVSNLKT